LTFLNVILFIIFKYILKIIYVIIIYINDISPLMEIKRHIKNIMKNSYLHISF